MFWTRSCEAETDGGSSNTGGTGWLCGEWCRCLAGLIEREPTARWQCCPVTASRAIHLQLKAGTCLLACLGCQPASQPTSCADLLALSLSPSNRSVRGDPKTAALSVALRLQSGEETRWLNALFTSEFKFRITPFLSNMSSGTFRRVVS